jgi:hypothetical protein
MKLNPMPVSWRIEGFILLESDERPTFEEWMAAVDDALGDSMFGGVWGWFMTRGGRFMPRRPKRLGSESSS